MIAYFLLNPPSAAIPDSAIRQIQERYANLVLDREEQTVRVANQLLGNIPGGSEKRLKASSRRGTSAQRTTNGTASSSGRSQSGDGSAAGGGSGTGGGSTLVLPSGPSGGAVRQAEEQVAGQGLLAILSSQSGQAAQDQTVTDVLGKGGQPGQNYDQVFQNIDRLASSGGSSRSAVKDGSGSGDVGTLATARGGRTTSSGVKSDGIISGPSGSGSGSGYGIGSSAGSSDGIGRTENIEVTGLTPLNEEGEDIKGGSGAVTGARDVAEVSAIVYRHSQAIQYCYERELKRNPDLKGKVVVRFTILPNGTVTNAQIVTSTLGNENVERCILSRVSRWDDFGVIDSRLGNAIFRQVYTFGF